MAKTLEKELLTALLKHEATLCQLIGEMRRSRRELQDLKEGYEKTLALTLSRISEMGLRQNIEQVIEEVEQELKRHGKYDFGGFKIKNGRAA